jgi:hypothetical protein
VKFRLFWNEGKRAGVFNLTDEIGHEGNQRRDVGMKKSLLATVAAMVLIAGAGFASAEGAKEQSGMKSGGAAAPTKSEAATKGAESKSGAVMKGKAETTGAGVESKSEMKNEPKSNLKADGAKTKPSTTGAGAADKSGFDTKAASDNKAGAAKTGTDTKAGADTKSNAAASDNKGGAAKTGADTKAGADTNSNAAAADTKAGASGSVNLTPDQKTKIRTTVIQSGSAPKVSRSSINFNISVGTVVPRSVSFAAVPPTLVEIHPAWRGYRYFVVDEEIVIIDPNTLRIVAVIDV